MKKIISLFILFVFTSCDFAPGSYPFSEIYEFDVSEEVLIKAVEEFKTDNPKYVLSNQERFIDGKRDKKDHWYHIWFYYPDRNKVVKSWIRGNKIAFVGIGDGMDLSNYKEINKDFSRQENKNEKEIFERLILDEINNYTPPTGAYKQEQTK
ncbi:hypothetical protein QLS91_11445 [Flavobacterium sp. LB2P84]|uniref:hypothetical protein n=1 Tax=Flavobacterium yafengii TaxID=3041253 RepID=UPI0024A89C45|nr:hypothetical protein [Flavobacterium yafengii]MDI6033690.1 hypothetical protein [Flavobacterium yafengii]